MKDNFFEVFERKMDEKHKQLKESGNHLVFFYHSISIIFYSHFVINFSKDFQYCILDILKTNMLMTFLVMYWD